MTTKCCFSGVPVKPTPLPSPWPLLPLGSMWALNKSEFRSARAPHPRITPAAALTVELSSPCGSRGALRLRDFVGDPLSVSVVAVRRPSPSVLRRPSRAIVRSQSSVVVRRCRPPWASSPLGLRRGSLVSRCPSPSVVCRRPLSVSVLSQSRLFAWRPGVAAKRLCG